MTQGDAERSRAGRQGEAARKKGQGSAHLGATLRSVLVAPNAGFQAALRSTERRAKRGTRPPEGLTPYVLAALGGSAAIVLWLKIAALAGLRDGSAAEYRISFLIATLVLGASLGVAAQFLWGLAGAPIMRAFSGEMSRPAARLVWGASFFPHVFALLLLLPIDLMVTGPSALTEARPSDSVGAGWAALSLAIGLALMVWSLALFAKGLEIASGVGLKRAVLGVVAGAACLVALGLGFRLGLVALAGAVA